jgi:ribosomal protein RSM22 (predicted rRNA methylase)
LSSRKTLESECLKFERQLKARFQPAHSNTKRKWSTTHYSEHTCQLYLLSRMAAEYSAMNRVFGELTKWLPNYTPKSIIDFGSGVGSVPWYIDHLNIILTD